MRIDTVKTEVYNFSELSDDAKETAISKHREDEYDYLWGEDAISSLKAFSKSFDINLKDYSLDNSACNSWITFDADGDDFCAEDIVGIRVFKYLLNNYEATIKSFIDCGETGYCMDCDIIQPIKDFIAKPNKTTTLHDLYDLCFDAFIKSWNADIEYQNSDEAITETIEANEYEFTADGELY